MVQVSMHDPTRVHLCCTAVGGCAGVNWSPYWRKFITKRPPASHPCFVALASLHPMGDAAQALDLRRQFRNNEKL